MLPATSIDWQRIGDFGWLQIGFWLGRARVSLRSVLACWLPPVGQQSRRQSRATAGVRLHGLLIATAHPVEVARRVVPEVILRRVRRTRVATHRAAAPRVLTAQQRRIGNVRLPRIRLAKTPASPGPRQPHRLGSRTPPTPRARRCPVVRSVPTSSGTEWTSPSPTRRPTLHPSARSVQNRTTPHIPRPRSRGQSRWHSRSRPRLTLCPPCGLSPRPWCGSRRRGLPKTRALV